MSVPTVGSWEHDAVVLAGGGARRLGGLDKPAERVGDRSLLDRVLAAVPAASRVVVVGPERPTDRPVTWVQEDPPAGGPAAALAAGLGHVTAPCVVLLAADLPFVDRGTVDRLLLAAAGHDGALLVDDSGRDQLLLGAWSTAALRRRVDGQPVHGVPLRRLLAGLDAVRVPGGSGPRSPWFDCDTADDLTTAREHA